MFICATYKNRQICDRCLLSKMILTFHEQGDNGEGVDMACNTLLDVYRVIRDIFPETSMECDVYFEIFDPRLESGTYWWQPATIDVIRGFNTMEFVRNRSTGNVRWCRRDMALQF